MERSIDELMEDLFKAINSGDSTNIELQEEGVKFEFFPKYNLKGDHRIRFDFKVSVPPGNTIAGFGAAIKYPKFEGDVLINDGGKPNSEIYEGFLISGEIWTDGEVYESEISLGVIILPDFAIYLSNKKFRFS